MRGEAVFDNFESLLQTFYVRGVGVRKILLNTVGSDSYVYPVSAGILTKISFHPHPFAFLDFLQGYMGGFPQTLDVYNISFLFLFSEPVFE